MKTSIITLIAFLLFAPAFSQKYFEGVVEYDITYESVSPDMPIDELKQAIGTQLKFYHKNGTYIREYINEKGSSIHKIMYLAADNKVYNINMPDPDTILFYNAKEKLFEDYKIIKGPAENILGCTCPSRIISYNYYEESFDDTVGITLEYYFCHQLPVNPDYYKNYAIWYELLKEEKSVALKFTEEWKGYFKVFYTAKKIDHVSLSEKIFELDKNAVLIERKPKDE